MAEIDLNAYTKDPISAMAKLAVFNGNPVDESTRQKLVQYGIPASVAARLSDRDCGVLGVISEIQGKDLPLDLKIIQAAYFANAPLRALDSDQARKAAQIQQDSSDGGCSLRQTFKEHSVDEIRKYFLEQGKEDLAAYRGGQIDSDDVLNSPLVVSRNLSWMPEIIKNINQGRAFIAVGQDHLYGQNGLLNLISRRGYSIQQVIVDTPKSPVPSDPNVAR
jgi:hypothetical protein